MKTIDLVQGSKEWHEHRATHFNASDAPAMLGVSKYKTRAQLVKEYATGIVQEYDAATERRFADGHRFEALARPIAEKIIGDSLSPIVGVNGKLSASFDGITFDESIIFEHKTKNAELRDIKSMDDLSDQYLAQIEQQLLVSGAEKCLFMASKWNANSDLEEEVHVWVISNQAMRNKLIFGWEQFEIDVANYKHVEASPEVIAAPTQDLPALSIQVNGSISLISNLQKFGARLNEFVATINKEPTDDQGFADAESAIKTLHNAQDALEAAEANALAQTADIDDMRKTVKLYADTARTTRLLLEKMVKARKESIRVEIVQTAKTEFGEHCFLLMKGIKPIVLNIDTPDFAGAIKGKKTIASLRKAAETALRNGKMEADALAADIRAKLEWYKEPSACYGFLFADLQSIITSNKMEAFQAIALRRIDDHKASEAAKLEAQRIAMQQEEERKAKAAQEAVLAAERAKMEAEVQAKARELCYMGQWGAPELAKAIVLSDAGRNEALALRAVSMAQSAKELPEVFTPKEGIQWAMARSYLIGRNICAWCGVTPGSYGHPSNPLSTMEAQVKIRAEQELATKQNHDAVQICLDDLDEAMDGRQKKAEALAGAISGIDGVDSLLAEAGYQAESSARNQLSIVRSLLTSTER